MRVLVLSENPLSGALGDGLRVLGLLAPLARRHRFDLLCFARPGEAPDPRAPEAFASVTALPYPATPRRAWPRRLADGFSIRNFRAQSPAMRAEVARRLAHGDADLVLDVACNMLLNLPDGPLPVPLVIDSIDEALLRDLRDLSAAPWRAKPRLAHQTFMFWRYERLTMARAHANVYVSEVDAATYRRIFPGRPASVVPNGVDTERFRPAEVAPDPATLVFEGNMMFGPNVDAARRLALEILPLVRARLPQARAVLVGRDPSAEVRALASEHVHVTGTVDDVRPHLARGTVFACPMRLGSGIKNKILQAWAMARPVVATPASLGGLAARDGENLLVREDNRGFAEAVVDLIRQPQRAAALGAGGRATVEREYAWSRRAAQFESILVDAIDRFRAERTHDRGEPVARRGRGPQTAAEPPVTTSTGGQP
jgi:glycosyltransferase involved in cell wall biosynthesis